MSDRQKRNSKTTKPVRRKYRNQPVEADGYRFDSRKEYRVYLQLKSMQQAGKVLTIEVHPRFPFPCGARYSADFHVVYADGQEEVIDVKSVATTKEIAYRMRIRMLKYHYPEVNFREV